MLLVDLCKLDDDGYCEDVCDTEVDMLVAFDWDSSFANGDPYEQFCDMLAKNVEVTGKGAYGPICDFSGFARPYAKSITNFLEDMYNPDVFEFDFYDEPEYVFVELLENLISGYATDSEYRGWLEVFK